jgi:deoxyadenosine/deoxycytidine kinase
MHQMETQSIQFEIEKLRNELRMYTNEYKAAITLNKEFEEVKPKPLYMRAKKIENKIQALDKTYLERLNSEMSTFMRFA